MAYRQGSGSQDSAQAQVRPDGRPPFGRPAGGRRHLPRPRPCAGPLGNGMCHQIAS